MGVELGEEMVQGERGGFRSVAGVDLGVDVGDMSLHRAFAEDQICGYLAVGLPLGQVR